MPQKFRYPFFTEMLWYVLERYVHVLLGRTHLALPGDEHGKLLMAIKAREEKVGDRYSSMIFFYEGLFHEASITMRRHQGKRTYTGWTSF